MPYRMYVYDLWGNDEDGYNVNDVFWTDTVLMIPDPIAEKDSLLIKFLKDNEAITKYIHNSKIRIDGEIGHTLYFSYNDIPDFELRYEPLDEKNQNAKFYEIGGMTNEMEENVNAR